MSGPLLKFLSKTKTKYVYVIDMTIKTNYVAESQTFYQRINDNVHKSLMFTQTGIFIVNCVLRNNITVYYLHICCWCIEQMDEYINKLLS